MRFLIILISILLFTNAHAQECLHTTLSKQFDYKISVTRNRENSDTPKGAKVQLSIFNKHKLLLQKLSFESPFLFEDAYKNCNDVRSYITKQNKNMEAPDNDYGDFIVADFNFDGKDDFAIKYDSGGNAGSIYVFYIQQDNMLFKKDIFLSNHVEFFPIDIDSKSKTVTTHAHADVYGYYESVFRFNTKTKKWKMSERTYVKS